MWQQKKRNWKDFLELKTVESFQEARAIYDFKRQLIQPEKAITIDNLCQIHSTFWTYCFFMIAMPVDGTAMVFPLWVRATNFILRLKFDFLFDIWWKNIL